MGETKNNAAIINATGRSKEEWFEIVESKNPAEMTHKEIAAWLQNEYQLSFWWSQEITVLYEKHAGRRKTGQTQDSGFQIGVSKTFNIPAVKLWELITSRAGFELISGDKLPVSNITETIQKSPAQIEYQITTLRKDSHIRMKWRVPEWKSHSILQVRVTGKGVSKAVLTFHQEKLDNEAVRSSMKQYWQKQIIQFEKLIAETNPADAE